MAGRVASIFEYVDQVYLRRSSYLQVYGRIGRVIDQLSRDIF